jgi:ABC-type dipeptide/oligopeptide/nickel transport system permease component
MELYKKFSKNLIIGVIILFIIILIAFLPEYYTLDFSLIPFSFNTDLNFQILTQNAFQYIKNVFSGNFGTSSSGLAVELLVYEAFMRSIYLIAFSFLISIFLGVLLSLITALNKGTSKVYNFISSIGISIPNVFLIISLQSLVVYLHTSGYSSLPLSGSDSYRHMILPIISLSIIPTVYVSKSCTKEIENIMKKDYIKTALSKGSSKLRILFLHVFKNLYSEILNSADYIITIILSSLLIVEYFFSYSGLAFLIYKSFQRSEPELLIACSFIFALTYYFFKLIKFFIKTRIPNN